MIFASRGAGISLLVPFKTDCPRRQRTWAWLARYWDRELPRAQVVVAGSDRTPFCKTEAVNRAFRQSRGDIVVILDADAYLAGGVILDCARQIRAARKAGTRAWHVPYRRFYRLTEPASRAVIQSDPRWPLRLGDPPADFHVEPASRAAVSHGHWFGALVQVMPREAFTAAGGMDERYNGGWGGDDEAFLHAVDTLWTRHRTTPNGVQHLWHPVSGTPAARLWPGQAQPRSNDDLGRRYAEARLRRARMQALTREPGHGGVSGA